MTSNAFMADFGIILREKNIFAVLIDILRLQLRISAEIEYANV